MKLEQLAHINKNELSMIEVAHAILEAQGNVVDFTELLVAIQEYLGFAESEFESRMSRFYTDINIDGRFISLGDNRWGLRAWYAIDEIDEEIITSAEEDEQPKRKLKKKRKLNAFADSDDMIDYNDDDPEDIDGIYDEEDETFEEEDEDEDEDDTASLTTIIDPDAEEEEEEDKELVAYKSDLTELGDEEIELDDDEDIEIDDEEDDEEEEEV